MASHILRRLIILPIVLAGVLLATFSIIHLTPGDPATLVAGEHASEEVVDQIRRDLGLLEPVHVQFTQYAGGVLQGDLGDSYLTRRPVASEISRTLPNTLELVVLASIISMVPGILLGTIAALRPGTIFDKATMVGALGGLSIPSFVSGLLLIWIFALGLGWLPTSGRAGPALVGGNWQHAILPALALGLGPMGSLARVTRSAMLEVMPEDYVRTARAKGLAERRVLLKHALKNALLPTITLMGLQMGYYLGGSVVVESVFGWPGMGRLSVQAILNQDFPLVQGTIMAFAVGYVVINLIVDLAYSAIDPRLRAS